MKYMGSKRWMLQNGLGMVLYNECSNAKHFVDLFAGSGAVSCFVAEKMALPVLACDLQEFSAVLINAVIARQKPLVADRIWAQWFREAQRIFPFTQIPSYRKLTRKDVENCRVWSENQRDWPITKAYGGHYFSPKQSTWIDVLRRTMPEKEPSSTVTLAALIFAASRCAASPGHTAQPFQPTQTAKKYLREAWAKDILIYTRQALSIIAPRFAMVKGTASVADANETAKTLKEGDIAFIDPPYSGVQYSRFYHVLETIAKGETGAVSGTGRYPDRSLRPQSRFSLKTHSQEELWNLLQTIADRKTKSILTFPSHECSNGLSGTIIIEMAEKLFNIEVKTVESKFSTLGGNNKLGSNREAIRITKELILILTPRS